MKAPMDTTLNLVLALEGAARPASEEIERLTGIADMLETLPDPDIDPRFIARLEATLMAEFDAQNAPTAEQSRPTLQLVKPEPTPVVEETPVPATAPNVITLPRRRFVARKALVAAVAAVMLMALPVVASASALPGSPFFGIKQWRQNHAISSAHGVEKAFVMQRVARTWYDDAAQMVALAYPTGRIESALERAGSLQAQAVRIVKEHGSPAEIAKLSAMIKVDAVRLERIQRLAPADAKAAVERAADRALDLVLKLVPAGTAAAVTVPGDIADAVEQTTRTAGSGGSAKVEGSQQGGSQAPQKPAAPQRPKETKHLEEWDDDACDILFGEAAGDLAAGPSVMLCKTEALYEDASK